jgi:hypothetical protein
MLRLFVLCLPLAACAPEAVTYVPQSSAASAVRPVYAPPQPYVQKPMRPVIGPGAMYTYCNPDGGGGFVCY